MFHQWSIVHPLLSCGSYIAVVDDDQSLCEALGRLLRAAGHEARTFLSAEAFLEDPCHDQASFVVADVQLGGMSGLELQRQLRSGRPDLPVAMISAHDEPETRAQAALSGCVVFLRKPFAGSLLLEAIRTAKAPSSPPN